ncbi:MAG: glycoside hydrolase family 15 protein [Actinomycetota bacterium]|nr:glycoside hydrolase family 15 protein [Actinomycetota bacterium]
MTTRIEDYALIGDTHSAGLVSKDGSIDWLCLPRFDSPAVFAALLDGKRGGHWSIRPVEEAVSISRRYLPDTLVLETTFETGTGVVRLTDCLAFEEGSRPDAPEAVYTKDVVVRLVAAERGSVRMRVEYAPRFDYGNIAPWLRRHGDVLEAVGGPDAIDLHCDIELELDHATAVREFTVTAGAEVEDVYFLAAYHPAHRHHDVELSRDECSRLLDRTIDFWNRWASRCSYRGRWREHVMRSLLTLKALTYSPTGGIVAAATTSLPEKIGGVRNWDYRYCWLRDATFSLDVLLESGYTAEAEAWRDWLLRAVAGDPDELRIMYGLQGERRLPELELNWLSGYEGSRPVRIGNAAAGQFQLDVYGEVMDSFHSAARAGIEPMDEAWNLQREIVGFVCAHWDEPDEGIWEVRSGRRHFVHSKVMAWVAVDRAVKAVDRRGREGERDRWAKTRDTIKEEVLRRGYDEGRGSFIRAYDEPELDASLLMLPLVGFIDARDPRMTSTIDAIARELTHDGLVSRYHTHESDDGLPPGEGTFLLCTFWLADCYALLGRVDEAEALMERLVDLCNDVGLLSEQYDPVAQRLVGNFPQAFSHVALVTTAMTLQAKLRAPRGG